MFQTILVPTDGSDQAVTALPIASDLAAAYRAQIVLLHVIEGDEVPEELARYAQIENLPKTKQTRLVEGLEATPHGPAGLPGGAQGDVDRAAVWPSCNHHESSSENKIRHNGLRVILACPYKILALFGKRYRTTWRSDSDKKCSC